jgi:bifunctional DNA-binding transcriptional regulator/antitoxin component of YhaV-PrlF toxin-antitoxin module
MQVMLCFRKWASTPINSFTGHTIMSEHIRAKIAKDGGLVIPEEFRRALGMEAGGEILLRMEDDCASQRSDAGLKVISRRLRN